MLWLAVALTLLARLPYVRLFIHFMVDNEEYVHELKFAVEVGRASALQQFVRQSHDVALVAGAGHAIKVLLFGAAEVFAMVFIQPRWHLPLPLAL